MDPSRSPKQLLTIQDVAELCGISNEHVRRLVDRGAFPKPIRLGRSVRFRLSDVMAWVESGCSPSQRPTTGENLKGGA